jgi:hypothetical protein
MPRIRTFNPKAGAAAKAKPVYTCTSCNVQHQPVKNLKTGKSGAPVQCRYCGSIEFWHFHSTSEAGRWATLLMLEKRGKIERLERQVRFPLYAYGRLGERIEVAFYVADFVYWQDGARVIEDHKPDVGAEPLAALKLKWMGAMGLPVRITT